MSDLTAAERETLKLAWSAIDVALRDAEFSKRLPRKAWNEISTVLARLASPVAANIQVEITDARELHCFRLLLPLKLDPAGEPKMVEIMLHATRLVELIHQASMALCEWQAQTSKQLILQKTGLSEDEARAAGLIA